MRTVNLDPLKQFTYNQHENQGFSFMLLNNKLQGLHTPFMCKDYLQDIFWTEYTKAPAADVYGLTWKRDSLELGDRFPLAILGGKFIMKNHAPYLLEFLNRFEAPLGITPTTIDTTQYPEVVVCWMDKEWTSNGPLLSSYTSLIRISGAYKGGDPIAYLKSLNKPLMNLKTFATLWTPDPYFMTPDISRLNMTITRFAALLHGNRPTIKWTDLKSSNAAHNCGIMGYAGFPQVAV